MKPCRKGCTEEPTKSNSRNMIINEGKVGLEGNGILFELLGGLSWLSSS